MNQTQYGQDVPELAKYLGQVIPFHLSPGIIVLSYIISLCGAISTLELMNRRTSRKGLYNHLLLIGAAISLGGVSIWCMHYIGNRAIILHHGEVPLQIAYRADLTVASFFVPIIVLLSAFLITANTTIITWWRILLSGALSGVATCGMHYLGSVAIRNYKCSYGTGYVVGAAVIAVFANTAALTLFFVFKARWTNSWWKRLGCAVVLSGSVSGMHWCAAVGTRYRLQNLENARSMMAHNATIIVVPFLAISSCLVMAGMAFHSSRVRKVYASKAQKITLAAAIFDDHGRILVTPDGNLPSEEITTTFLQKTQHDVFSTGHPLFHWIYQASRDWYLISRIADKMESHLASLPHSPTSYSRKARMGIEFIDEEGKLIEDYDVIFREMFCLATVDLSTKMNMTLDEAGVLWDEILTTGGGITTSGVHSPDSDASGGGLDRKGSASTSAAEISQKTLEELAEKGMIQTGDQGHGSLMFLVKRVQGSYAIDKLEASGHLFADLHQVCRIMNNSMQIRTGKLEEKLRSMERYTQDAMLDPGVHVGLFAIRARADVQQFDVMVRKEARGLLPSVKLPSERLDASDLAFLRRHDGLSMSYFLKRYRHSEEIPQQDARIARFLYDAIKDLRSLVDDTLFDEATLVAKVSQVPCKSPDNDSRTFTCSMLTFCMMIPIHKSVNCPQFEFTPLPFFKVRQLAYKNSPYHGAFARSVHREIYPILNNLRTTSTAATNKRRVPAWLSSSCSWLRSPISMPILPFWRRPSHKSHDLHPWRHQGKDMDSSSLVSSSKENVLQPSSHRTVSTHSLDVYSSINSDDNKGGIQIQLQPQSPPPLSSFPSPYPGLAEQQGQPPTEELMARPTLHLFPPRDNIKPRQLSFGGIMISQDVSISVDDSAPAVTSSPHTPPHHLGLHNNHHRHGNHHQHSNSAGRAFDLQMQQHGLGKKKRFLSTSGDKHHQDRKNQRGANLKSRRPRSGSMSAELTFMSTTTTSSPPPPPPPPPSHSHDHHPTSITNRRNSYPTDPLNPPLDSMSPDVDQQPSDPSVIGYCRTHPLPHNHNHNHNHNHTAARHGQGLGQGLGQLGPLSTTTTFSPPPLSTDSLDHHHSTSPTKSDFSLAIDNYNKYNNGFGMDGVSGGVSGGGSSSSVGGGGLRLGAASKVEVKKDEDVVMTFVDDLFSVCVNSSSGAGAGAAGRGSGERGAGWRR